MDPVFRPRAPIVCNRCPHTLSRENPGLQHVCGSCGWVQSIRSEGQNYFTAFGLEPKFQLSDLELNQIFYRVSRVVHPDRFGQSETELKKNALERMSLINDAYRILKNPDLRRAHLLKLLEPEYLVFKGSPLYGDSNQKKKSIPLEVSEAWFEAQDVGTREEYLKFERYLSDYQNTIQIELKQAEIDFDQNRNLDLLEVVLRKSETLSYLRSIQNDLKKKMEQAS